MRRTIRLSALLCSVAGTGCASTVKLESYPKAQVSVHAWGDASGPGQPIGETPLEVDRSQVEGRIVELAAPGRQPQYFVFPAQALGPQHLTVTLAAKPQAGPTPVAGVTLEQVNKLNRRLLAVVQAILAQDYKAANDLARSVAETNPRLAAPFVLQGLANLYDGDRAGARVAFKNAQTLDPGDHAVVEMLKVLQ